MPKVSIVVLQFNQSDRTLACLESLAKLVTPTQGRGDLEVVVVDNASETKHLKNVEYWIEMNKAFSFQLLASSENLGYSGGNNLGIKYALEHGAEYVLILNNDTMVERDFLDRMLEVDSDIVGTEWGKAFWLHISSQPPFTLKGGATTPPLSVRGGWGTIYLSGVALLIKREVVAKIGYFDERYFLYFEDVDFSIRAQKAGFTLARADVVIHHETSATSRTLPTTHLFYYHTRNALLLNATHGPWFIRLALPFWKWWIILKQHVKILFGRNLEISQAILQGLLDYEKGIFGKRKLR